MNPLKDDRGIAATEFALILPILLLILTGSYELTAYARAIMRLQVAADCLADLATRSKTISASDVTNYCNGAKLALNPYPTSTFQATLASVSNSSSTIATDWQDTTCGSGSSISNATSLASNFVSSSGDSIVVVQANLTYTPLFSVILSSSMAMSVTSYSRPRYGSTITHS